jgi:hypothetical protein
VRALDSFFAAYIRALDDRRFDDWLAMFADDGVYSVIRAEDHRANNHLYLLRENKEKLRNRIDSGVRLDHDMRVHLVAGVQGSNGLASANFMMLRNGALTYSGQYHVSFERGDKIRHCNAVLNDSGLDLLYLPI